MSWNEKFSRENKPDISQIMEYIGKSLWEELCEHLENTYKVLPMTEHSICSGAPGWNVKYRKGGRALCTLYPHEGYFTCLVTIGNREAEDMERMLGAFTEYVRELYLNTRVFNGSRWLMIDVRSEEVLNDVKMLVNLRVKTPKK